MPDTNQACIQKGSYFSLHILPILLTGSCSLLLKRWFRRSPVAALTGDTRPCFFLVEVEWLCLFQVPKVLELSVIQEWILLALPLSTRSCHFTKPCIHVVHNFSR